MGFPIKSGCFRRSNINIPQCDNDGIDYGTWLAPSKSQWTDHKGKNCYSGHGAIDLESSPGAAAFGNTIAACKAECDNTPGCTGVTIREGPSGSTLNTCYRRRNISLAECDSQGPGIESYHTWTKALIV
jgi:hypothetical protein